MLNKHFEYNSLPITKNNEPLILQSKIFLNSIPRLEIFNYEYYNYLQPLINKFCLVKDVYQYSFCLDPGNAKSNGTLNFSKIDDAYIQLILNNIVNYQTTVNVKAYGIFYNILVIKNGSCALKYTI